MKLNRVDEIMHSVMACENAAKLVCLIVKYKQVDLSDLPISFVVQRPKLGYYLLLRPYKNKNLVDHILNNLNDFKGKLLICKALMLSGDSRGF